MLYLNNTQIAKGAYWYHTWCVYESSGSVCVLYRRGFSGSNANWPGLGLGVSANLCEPPPGLFRARRRSLDSWIIESWEKSSRAGVCPWMGWNRTGKEASCVLRSQSRELQFWESQHRGPGLGRGPNECAKQAPGHCKILRRWLSWILLILISTLLPQESPVMKCSPPLHVGLWPSNSDSVVGFNIYSLRH